MKYIAAKRRYIFRFNISAILSLIYFRLANIKIHQQESDKLVHLHTETEFLRPT